MINKPIRLFSASIITLLLSQSAFAIGDAAKQLQDQWALTKYQTPQTEREKRFETLAEIATTAAEQHPDDAEVLVWQAIILSTYAGEKGGLGALGLVKKAKSSLEQAEKIDAEVLNGSVYTSLGSLYYQVPGWPVSFGDDKKARQYLEKALSLNPDGIDSNYFYGDFLIEEGEYVKAVNVLEKALNAPPRPDRSIADAGRKQEIEAALVKAKSNLH